MLKKRYKNILSNLESKNIAFTKRTIAFQSGEVSILYVKELTDRASLTDNVIKPLVKLSTDLKLKSLPSIQNIIYVDDFHIENDEIKIEDFILAGKTVIIFSNVQNYVVIDLTQVAQRKIPDPELNYTLRGPRDCFIENLDTNLSLIRYRLKDSNLRIDMKTVGKRTKTRVAVIYFEDIANNKFVTDVKKRIDNINVDGIIESGELQAFLLNSKFNLFPQMGIIERSDMACGALLEGKVVTIGAGSGLALVSPKLLGEFLSTCEDFYDNKYMGLFLRIIRSIAIILSFTISAMYIAIVSYHNDILPSNYIIAIAKARINVPFNAFFEVLIIEIITELLREALVRVPGKIGTAIGIVGAIIIGEAAISAGVFSPLLLIVVSTALISSFVIPDYTLSNPLRLIKFLLIVLAGIFGFYGFILGFTLIIFNIISTNSFGVAYGAPRAPIDFKDYFRTFFYSKSIESKRPSFLFTKDKYRGGNKK